MSKNKLKERTFTLDDLRPYIDPVTLIFNPPPDWEFRSKEVKEAYQKEKEIILKNWDTLADYCKFAFLNYAWTNWESTAVTKTSKSKSANLIPNNFGYDLVENTIHFVLWYNEKANVKAEIAKIVANCEAHGIKREDMLIFQNSPQNQTVPSLSHYHFLIPNLKK